MDDSIRRLEEAVISGWPASETADLDGWLLRASGGPTHRGNSVSTLRAGTMPMDVRIAVAERWYRERAQPILVQLGPYAMPPDLDSELAARGYRIGGAASAFTASARQLSERAQSSLQAETTSEATKAWLAIAADGSRFATSPASLLGVLARLGSRCVYVLARDAGKPVAACLGVSSEEQSGVYLMLTLPSHRRRGAASALLGELARAAIARGHEQLYLLCERDNAPANALYASVGFEHRYDYHYRVHDT
jgi:GNAT superfamily N-acetyltransferase